MYAAALLLLELAELHKATRIIAHQTSVRTLFDSIAFASVQISRSSHASLMSPLRGISQSLTMAPSSRGAREIKFSGT